MFCVELFYILVTILGKKNPTTFLTTHKMEVIIPVALLFCCVGAALW